MSAPRHAPLPSEAAQAPTTAAPGSEAWGPGLHPHKTVSQEGLRTPTYEETRAALDGKTAGELIADVLGLVNSIPADTDESMRANTVVVPAASVWAMRYHQTRRQLQRERLGSALFFALLGLAFLLMGCCGGVG